MNIFDELRGAVLDLPMGTILPGWVQKSAVIEMIDKFEDEHEQASYDERCPVCLEGGHVVPPPHRMAVPIVATIGPEWRDHTPSGAGYEEVSCSCGWDSGDKLGWEEHIDAADRLGEALG